MYAAAVHLSHPAIIAAQDRRAASSQTPQDLVVRLSTEKHLDLKTDIPIFLLTPSWIPWTHNCHCIFILRQKCFPFQLKGWKKKYKSLLIFSGINQKGFHSHWSNSQLPTHHRHGTEQQLSLVAFWQWWIGTGQETPRQLGVSGFQVGIHILSGTSWAKRQNGQIAHRFTGWPHP